MGWRDGVKTHYRGGATEGGRGGQEGKLWGGDGQWVLIHTEKKQS